jgi:formate hydrogenlyase subunit 3/multisubunit Na+/H+ antiporter MnhD subunit
MMLAIFATPEESLYLPWLLLGTELGLDDTGHTFLILTALLWWLAGFYAKTYIPQHEHARFFSFFNSAMLGNAGLILAQDMISFYLFFTLMSFAAYGIVVHQRDAAAFRAGKIYIILVVIGEAALFAALVSTAVISGTLSFDAARPMIAQSDELDWIVALAVIGFGIKAGMIGLHVWLPLAHPVAPTPASAVLSGAMIKAGLLGWLRLLPLGEVMLYPWGVLFITLGLTAAFYAVVIGLMQRDAKTLLAYSSISQMGVLTAAVGLGLMAPNAWPGILAAIIVYTLHHGLAKGTLFLGVGVLGMYRGKSRRLAWIGLWLPALALAGAPFTSGMVAKSLLKMQTLHAPETWNIVFQALLPCSAIATALLLGKFLYLQLHPVESRKFEKTGLFAMLAPWVMLLMAVASLPWWPLSSQPDTWSNDILLNSLWPIIIAGLIMLASVTRDQWFPRRLLAFHPHGRWQSITAFRVPAGDLLIPVEYGAHHILSLIRRFAGEQLPHWRQSWELHMQRIRARIESQQMSEHLESFLCKWPIALICFISLGLLLAWWGLTA